MDAKVSIFGFASCDLPSTSSIMMGAGAGEEVLGRKARELRSWTQVRKLIRPKVDRFVAAGLDELLDSSLPTQSDKTPTQPPANPRNPHPLQLFCQLTNLRSSIIILNVSQHRFPSLQCLAIMKRSLASKLMRFCLSEEVFPNLNH